MPKTLINLSEQDKVWLDQQAKSERIPMTEVVRRAIRYYRVHAGTAPAANFDDLLANTRGIWKSGDGLAFQQSLREEWEDR